MPPRKATKKKDTAAKGGKKKELTRAERLNNVMDGINSHFKGRVLIQRGSEVQNVFILRRPTGITSLDLAIGGGAPAGGMTIISGPEGTGKDYLCNRTIAALQQHYGEDTAVAMCMTELSVDKKYAKMCGVRIALSNEEIEEWQNALKRPFTEAEMAWAKDQVGTFHHVVATNAEEILEVAAQLVEQNLYQIVVINSFGALLTKAEEESDITQKHYGGAATTITAFMHRMHAALMPTTGSPNRTTILGINQARDNIGNIYDPIKTSGGWALKHGKLVDIFLQARSRIKLPIGGNKMEIVGKEIHWEIKKGKAGCHDGPKGMYPFYFGKSGYPFGADVYQDLITVGVMHNIINMSGAWLSFEDENYQLRAQGKEKFSHEIAAAPGAFDYLRGLIFEATSTAFITREPDEQT